jgi:hypothetical protein
MKFAFPPRFVPGDSPIRPGFDVLMAVTGARQATSPTARLVATRRPSTAATEEQSRRCKLFANGRLQAVPDAVGLARFADVAVVQYTDETPKNTTNGDMNAPFTKAFQPMVKHSDVPPTIMAGHPDGDGTGME